MMEMKRDSKDRNLIFTCNECNQEQKQLIQHNLNQSLQLGHQEAIESNYHQYSMQKESKEDVKFEYMVKIK